MGLRGGGGGVKNKVWIGIQVYKACTVGVLFRDCEFMWCSQSTLSCVVQRPFQLLSSCLNLTYCTAPASAVTVPRASQQPHCAGGYAQHWRKTGTVCVLVVNMCLWCAMQCIDVCFTPVPW